MNGKIFRKLLRQALVPPIAFLTIIAILLYMQTQWLAHSAQWVDHTDEVIGDANDSEKSITQAQAAVRGYFILPEMKFLESYKQELEQIQNKLNALKAKVSDNPPQVERLNALYVLIGDWKALWDAEVSATQRSHSETLRKAAEKMNVINAAFNSFILTEENLRDQRIAKVNFISTTVTYCCMVLALLAGGLLSLLVRKQLMQVSNLYIQALTDSERATDEAIAASRSKDEFLAMCSHELRTPLTSILGWARLLSNPKLPADRVAHGIRVIERNTRAEAKLVDDLLDVARTAKGKFGIRKQPVEIADVIEAASDWARPVAEAKNIKFNAAIEDPGMLVRGDFQRLQQVLWNLISNGLKFTPAGGQIELLAKNIGSQVEITVSDTGVGIEPEFAPHLFEPFWQAQSSTSTQGGLGIGLSLTKTIVEAHGGIITAASGGPKKGSRFTIHLPLMSAKASRTPVQPANANYDCGHKLEGVHVLVVEDEPDALEVIKVVLEDCGALVNTALNADDALKVADKQRPDVLVTDLRMPGKDGISLLHELKARGITIPSAVLTALASPEDEERTKRAGFNVHLAKPVEPSTLAVVVADLHGAEPAEQNNDMAI